MSLRSWAGARIASRSALCADGRWRTTVMTKKRLRTRTANQPLQMEQQLLQATMIPMMMHTMITPDHLMNLVVPRAPTP